MFELLYMKIALKIVSGYDQEIAPSQIADKPVVPWGRATQQSRDTRKTKLSNYYRANQEWRNILFTIVK